MIHFSKGLKSKRKNTRSLILLLTAIITSALLSGMPYARAEIKIETFAGQTYRIPVDPSEVKSIKFSNAADNSQPPPSKQRISPSDRSPQQTSGPRRFRVGPGRAYERPSELAKIAQNGDTIEIEAGLYESDYAVWRQNNITFKGINGRPHLKANARINNRKAIWVITGKNVVIDNLEFSHARVPDSNGAGIRSEGDNLSIRNSYFHHNEIALLSAPSADSEIIIEHSLFEDQKRRDKQGRKKFTHGVYVGDIRSLVFTNNTVSGTQGGHHLKSRARHNLIRYNRFLDKDSGSASYAIDLPNCGISYIIGNLMQKGRLAENNSSIAYGAEGCGGQAKGIWLVNNTLVFDSSHGRVLHNHSLTEGNLINNLIVGAGSIDKGPAKLQANLHLDMEKFRNRAQWDFHLSAGAKAIDQGVNPGKSGTLELLPQRQPATHKWGEIRRTRGRPDVGAFEWNPK